MKTRVNLWGTGHGTEAGNASAFRLPRWLEVVLAIVVLLQLVAPFVAHTYGTDGPTHMYWTTRFGEMLSQGVLVPRWVPSGFRGYGSPAFYFYPPVYFYASNLVKVVLQIGEPYMIMQMTGLLLTIASFGTTWFLLRTVGAPRYQALIGSSLYAFAPFRIAELYSRTSLPAHLSYVFLPLLWCGLYLIISRENGRSGVILTGVSAALMFLSSIPLTVGTLALLPLVAIAEREQLTPIVLRRIAAAVALCLGLTAYQLISIATYKNDIQLAILTRIPDYLILDVLHGRMLPAFYHYALLYLSAAILAVVYFRPRTRQTLTPTERNVLRGGLVIIACFAFLDTPIVSEPIWSAVSLIAQGTWRNYIYFLLFAAVVTGTMHSKVLRTSATFITALWCFGALLPLALILTDAHFYRHDPGRTGDTPEYLPKAASLNFLTSVVPAAPQDPLPAEDSRARSPGGDTVTYHRFYWPAWHLYANDSEIRTWPDSVGRARAAIPAQPSRLFWRLERTPLEQAGLWISGLTVGALLVAGGIGLVRSSVSRRNTSTP
ncbi:MAG: hypothetical protein Q8922_10275 [Bacteroidota bacterium]|nr:hypothetical protein [Bacteroidota bacterium]MDP4233918.1 hypothetical protein [Bacteroidota bacterium]MDP4242832.1 hypothetical protein [Bacteroidota bacterium]MDP4288310.1 hypothetical protein [Bacteroidota bacterium]